MKLQLGVCNPAEPQLKQPAPFLFRFLEQRTQRITTHMRPERLPKTSTTTLNIKMTPRERHRAGYQSKKGGFVFLGFWRLSEKMINLGQFKLTEGPDTTKVTNIAAERERERLNLL